MYRAAGLCFFCLTTTLVFVSGCNQQAPVPPETELLGNEENFTEAPGGDWEWVRHDPDAVRFTDEGLQIRIQPGGLMGAGKSAKNIFTRSIPEGATQATITVSHDAQNQYAQAGLILYTDDDNYIKLVREYLDGATTIVFVTEVEAHNQLPGKAAAQSESSIVRLDWSGDLVEAYVILPDTEEPMMLGRAEFSVTPETRIGVFAQDGVEGADHWATFTNMVLTSQED